MAQGLLKNLIDALCCLPGVGQKSAQRMAFYLLERDRDGGKQLGELLHQAMQKIGRCSRCRTLTELQTCSICSSQRRDNTLLCVVETPGELEAIEQLTDYRGFFFVLHGRLSPLDGLGPAEIGMEELQLRLDEGEIAEVILATNPTVEGEATAHYISEMAARHNVLTTRIAHGVPLGGELEYLDGGTLSHAISGRREFE